MKYKRLLLFVSLAFMVSMLFTACGGEAATEESVPAADTEEESAPIADTEEESPAEPAEEDSVRVGIFVDSQFGNNFFDTALAGGLLIEEKYNAVVSTYEGRLQSDNFAPLMSDAAKNNDLVFVLGFEGIDAMFGAAEANPDTLFIFLDAPIESDNLASLAYSDEEGCFIAGALAAGMTSHTEAEYINEDKVIGFVGGVDAPVIRRCLSGYTQGAALIDPEVIIETVFVGDFLDPAKGKEASLALVDKGVDIQLQYAGLSSDGGFNAAKEGAPFYLIGSGTDMRPQAPDNTIGSILKRVDLSVEYLTGLFVEGELNKGDIFFSGIADGGLVFIFSEDLVPADVIQAAQEAVEMIKAGEITVTD